MNILSIIFAYNELPYIPYWANYYKQQGCQLYVIDNMSTDGTWEWLQDNKIPSHRKDTKNSFQLEWLFDDLVKTLHSIKPDWFLIAGIDMFHVLEPNRICDTIAEAELCGFNQIRENYLFQCANTGSEVYNHDMRKIYFYAKKMSHNCCYISKYDPEVKIHADVITIPNIKTMYNGVMFDYGACKPKAVNEEKLRRRQKAWDEFGTPRGHGIHYRQGKELNWTWDKDRLIDVREMHQVKSSLNRLISMPL